MSASILFGDSDSVLANYTLGTNKNINIINSSATGKIIVKLGTDTNDTSFDINNNSASSILSINGLGNLSTRGSIYHKSNISIINTAGNVQYTFAQINGGIIERDGQNAGRSDTFPAASNIVSNIPNCVVGSSFEFTILNITSGNNAITVNAGGTFQGTTIRGKKAILEDVIKTFKAVVTNIGSGTEAVNIYTIGQTRLN